MRVFTNQFLKGINSDLDYSLTPNEQYLEAHNLTLTGDNKFLVLENIAGTTEVSELLAGFSGTVLRVYANKYKISSVSNIESLTIFTVDGSNFKILCYDLDNNTLYELFQEATGGQTELDAVVYPENGIDIIYFTDGVNEMRKLRCEISTPHTPNSLKAEQLSLQRRATLATVNLNQIYTTGGSLLCGSYQACLRFYNQNTKTYTKWTIPAHPVNISRVTTGLGEGGYNMSSSKRIEWRFSTPTAETSLWTHYQFAIIENTKSTNTLDASLLKLETLSGGSINGEYTEFDFIYDSNIRIGIEPISEIVVDIAAVQFVKTLAIKNNKLFAGNVTYYNLEYDRNPIASGSITTPAVDNKDDFQTSTKRGYFGDEVYRLYVSYFDEKYNFSRPKALDLSTITGNTSTSTDIRFPSRKLSSYSIMDSSNNIRYLNLDLTLDNHPSWAKGFIILRADRKKRIKLQTPFVPSSLVEGVEVLGTYPAEGRSLGTAPISLGGSILIGGDIDKVQYPSASPMNPVGTLTPKNYFHTVKKDIIRQQADDVASDTQKGECYYSHPTSIHSSNGVYFGFSQDVYNTSDTSFETYEFSSGDKFELTNYAFLRLNYTNFVTHPKETKIGNFSDTSIHGSFFATGQGDYYYSPTVDRSDPSLPLKTGEIIDYKQLDAFGEGTSIQGIPVGNFSNLETTTVQQNPKPNNQRIGIFKIKSNKQDSALYGSNIYGANQLVSASGGAVNQNLYELTLFEQTNSFAPSKTTISSGTYVSIVDIANIVNDYDDDRYGDADDIHDMVYTGANYVFSPTELATVVSSGNVPVNLSVAGGDCYVSLHQFKLTDNHYGLINSEKTGAGTQLNEIALLERWDRIWLNKYDTSGFAGEHVVSMPCPYKNVSQVLSVVLESEVIGELLDVRPYDNDLSDSGKFVVNETDNEQSLRIPFTYLYNSNYTKESNQKAFIPFSPTEEVVTRYPSRGIYSDVKVTNILQGFDIFRTSNTFDLEENQGELTKLALDGDDLVALQRAGVAYLPVDATVVETADGKTMTLRGDVVDTPIYLDRQYGCSFLPSVSVTSNAVFFSDNVNKTVIKLSDRKLSLISENGMIKEFNDILGTNFARGLYDNNRRQYLVHGEGFCWVWDDRLGVWVSNQEFTGLETGFYTKGNLYLTGLDSDGNLNLYTHYTGSYGQLFGRSVTPRVLVSVNEEYNVPKTFDNIILYSSEKLDLMDIDVEKESAQSGFSVSNLDIEVNRREGNYRVATLRDSNSARLRGLRAVYTIKWVPTVKTSLTAVATKYRISQYAI